MMQVSEIDNAFTHHPPVGDQVDRYQALREAGKNLAYQIAATVPAGHERDLALDRLREVVMWANAGIACNNPHGQADPLPGAVSTVTNDDTGAPEALK
jgi:hypothetical protein